MRWLIHDKRISHLGNFRIFLFLIFLLDQHQSVIESVADFPPPPAISVSCSFSKWKKVRGGSLVILRGG